MKRRMSVKDGTDIVVIASVDGYRKYARTLPLREDVVLEIGCSTGETTKILAKHCRHVIAVDISFELVERVRSIGLTNLTVETLDAQDVSALIDLILSPDLIFIDIGGDAQLDNVCFQLRQCLRAFRPRAIVIRSIELDSLVSHICYSESCSSSIIPNMDTTNRESYIFESLMDLSYSKRIKNRVFAVKGLLRLNNKASEARLEILASDPDIRVRKAIKKATNVTTDSMAVDSR